MNSVFISSFLLFLLVSIFMDRNKLKPAKRSFKSAYYGMVCLALGLLVCHVLHIRVPLPPSYFIQTVSPWVSRMIGL